ncbi:potassium channel protein [candidate division TA06 bacterium]|nr:potassium channel protein [candidate division TA06 bacterium]
MTRPLLLLLFWVLLGAIGFSLIEKWSFIDSLYMTIITISTVGYGEVHTLSPMGRIFASFIIVAGIGTAVYAFTRLGQLVFEGELLDLFGRRKMKSELERLSDHYIVCGFGRIGKLVTEGLAERLLQFCVVESNPTLEEDLQTTEYLYLIGDATEEEVLKNAGIEKAKALLAMLPSDADNLYLTMVAKEMNPKIQVIARALDEKAEMKLKRGGADEVVSPYKTASLRVLQAAVKPTVVEFMELATSRQHLELSLEEVKVAEKSVLDGHSIAESDIRRQYGVIILAIKRDSGEMVFNPDPSERTVAGDILVAIGRNTDLKKLEESCQC